MADDEPIDAPADAPAEESGGNPAVANALNVVKCTLFGAIDDKDSHDPTWVNQLLLAVLAAVIILITINLVRMIITRIMSERVGSPYIVKSTKDARRELVVKQNDIDDGTYFRRSLNERAGIEFSYSMWLFVSDWEYKKGEWKHVMHKGNAERYPNRAPGLWLHPDSNIMRLYMNTYSNISNYVDIANIPVAKWFHLAIVLKSKTIDIFVNGRLKKQMTLDSLPRQNFGDLYVNSDGGFSGYISNMRYYDYAVTHSEIDHALAKGPSFSIPSSATTKPPYYKSSWYLAD